MADGLREVNGASFPAIDGDMGSPRIGRLVEQQKIERLQVGDSVRVLLVFPKPARPEIRHVQAEVPQQLIGEMLAVRATRKPLYSLRAGIRCSVASHFKEVRRNLKYVTHISQYDAREPKCYRHKGKM